MKNFSIVAFIMLSHSSIIAQDNFVDGKIIFIDSKVIDAQINDQFWEKIPESFEYRSATGLKAIVFPKDVKEIRIGSKSIYRSFEFLYDSSSRIKNELTTSKEPSYKKAHLFLKVLVDSDIALLSARIQNVERYFIQHNNKLDELINHVFISYVNDQELKQENRLYVNQLSQAFALCTKISVNAKLEYNDIVLTKLFADYSACAGDQAKQYQKKEKPVILIGVVGAIAYDQMIHNFDGSFGFSLGGFVTIYMPHRIYKNSVYTELSYRMFGDQLWTGLDYVGLPYKETHQIRSIKLTSIIRKRLSIRPALPHSAYKYIGAGITTSFGLKDLYQRGPYSASTAVPFAGIVFNSGIYITKNISFDFRFERGSKIQYGDYVNQDNREPLSLGYYSFQGSLLLEF